MKDRQKLISHALLVMAPLLMVFALTAAWFVSSSTTPFAPMSFASKSSGPGAVLYRAAKIENRVYDKLTLKNDVTWGPLVAQEEAKIAVENMQPGQCDYYLLVADGPSAVYVSKTLLKTAAGTEVATGTDLPLAQCIGVYLQPVSITPGTKIEGMLTKTELTLTRSPADTGRLNAALFHAVPPGPNTPISPTPAQNAYVLAVFCDPVYQQGQGFAPVNILEGSIGFSLSFGGG